MHSFTYEHKVTMVIGWSEEEAPKLLRRYYFSGTVQTQGDRDVFLHGIELAFKVNHYNPVPMDLNLVQLKNASVQAAVKDGSRPAEGRKDHFPLISVNELAPETREQVLQVVQEKFRAVQAELLAQEIK